MNLKPASGISMPIIHWVTGIVVSLITLLCGYTVVVILPIASATNVLEVKMQQMEKSASSRDASIERTAEIMRTTREEMLRYMIDPKKIEALTEHMHDQTIYMERINNRLERIESQVLCNP